MFYLGIDGGGSGCRAALADAGGTVIARAEGGPANIASDYPGALRSLLAVAEQVAQGRAVRAVLGLAGANLSGAAGRLERDLPFPARVVQDVTTSVRGALGPADGIVAAIGTGSVFARQQGGRVTAIGGWGLRLGDEASGGWIGQRLVARVTRGLDGFVPMTPLLQALAEELGGPAGIVAFSLRATPPDWAAFAPRALENDPAAQAVRAEAEAEIRAAIGLLQTRPVLPVTWLGGLGPRLALDDWPQRAALGTALDGALALAREDMTWTS
ncbi:BadF/BadG/BcrA/BcrD ATPase family protein [Paenirhodobacter sp.]|uniref:BadF/BadG/BcrA/BcrD ATPase family protein n=1 Tax=Paenirhodobacter sp. TaxID=1965326 RepID=UPI003B3F681F